MLKYALQWEETVCTFSILYSIWISVYHLKFFDGYETFEKCVDFMNMLNVKVYITSEVRRKVWITEALSSAKVLPQVKL